MIKSCHQKMLRLENDPGFAFWVQSWVATIASGWRARVSQSQRQLQIHAKTHGLVKYLFQADNSWLETETFRSCIFQFEIAYSLELWKYLIFDYHVSFTAGKPNRREFVSMSTGGCQSPTLYGSFLTWRNPPTYTHSQTLNVWLLPAFVSNLPKCW